jgi:hypothetical protein
VRVARRIQLFTLLILMPVVHACTTRPQSSASPAGKRVEFSILEDYDKGDDLAEVARDFDLFKELGVTTWRGSFGWDDFEPAPGRYDLNWLHEFADLAASRGIVLRPYIGYTPKWAAAGGTDGDVWNDPPKDLEAWSRFVRTLAADMRRHRNIVSYEIYNEENVRQWWDGSVDAYRDVLRRGAGAIERGNPDAQVVLGGMVYPDGEWTERVCSDEENRRAIAAVPFHAYPETWTPADVTVETYLGKRYTDFVRQTDEACGRKPMWINETGYATTPKRTEQDQARWWIRAMATFIATPRIEYLGIYEIKDLRQDRPAIGDAPNYHLGLTDSTRRKKLAFSTVARLISIFRGQSIASSSPPISAAESGSAVDIHRHLFTRADGRRWLFLWAAKQPAIVDVQLDSADTRAREFALDGTPASEVRLSKGHLSPIALEPGGVRFFEIVR